MGGGGGGGEGGHHERGTLRIIGSLAGAPVSCIRLSRFDSSVHRQSHACVSRGSSDSDFIVRYSGLPKPDELSGESM